MNKLSFKNIFALSVTAVLAVGGFFVGARRVFAEISGEDLVADMAPADLSAVASKWPYLLLIGLIIVVLLCLVSVFYRPKEKNKQ